MTNPSRQSSATATATIMTIVVTRDCRRRRRLGRARRGRRDAGIDDAGARIARAATRLVVAAAYRRVDAERARLVLERAPVVAIRRLGAGELCVPAVLRRVGAARGGGDAERGERRHVFGRAVQAAHHKAKIAAQNTTSPRNSAGRRWRMRSGGGVAGATSAASAASDLRILRSHWCSTPPRFGPGSPPRHPGCGGGLTSCMGQVAR